MKELKSYLERERKIIDKGLEKYLYPAHAYPPLIHRAVRYSVFSGGKRLRPIMVIAAARACGGGGIKRAAESLLRFACGIEMIHTYSLIHDDLPALDNDRYRRGKLSCHAKYGEAIAILAGDALLTRAFHILSLLGNCGVAREVAEAIGSTGMIGGQVEDMTKSATGYAKKIEYICSRKTAFLIRVSLRGGAMIAGGSAAQIAALDRYGRDIGFAFQITDDLLDVKQDRKTSYPAVFGAENSKNKAASLIKNAKKSLDIFGDSGDILKRLADYIGTRGK